MELDDFKKKNQMAQEPGTFFNSGYDEKINELIDHYKSDQKKQRRQSSLWIAIMIMFAMFYFTNPGNQAGLTNIGLILIGTGFILGAIYLYFRYIPLSNISYSLPLNEFLLNAEKRLNYLNPVDWFIVIPLLIILGTGGGLIFIERLNNYIDNLTMLVIIWIIFFILLSLFAFWAGRKNWNKEHESLLKKIIEMKNNYSANHN